MIIANRTIRTSRRDSAREPVDGGLGYLNPLLNCQPPCVLHFLLPMGLIKPPDPGFWILVVYRNAIQKKKFSTSPSTPVCCFRSQSTFLNKGLIGHGYCRHRQPAVAVGSRRCGLSKRLLPAAPAAAGCPVVV